MVDIIIMFKAAAVIWIVGITLAILYRYKFGGY